MNNLKKIILSTILATGISIPTYSQIKDTVIKYDPTKTKIVYEQIKQKPIKQQTNISSEKPKSYLSLALGSTTWKDETLQEVFRKKFGIRGEFETKLKTKDMKDLYLNFEISYTKSGEVEIDPSIEKVSLSETSIDGGLSKYLQISQDNKLTLNLKAGIKYRMFVLTDNCLNQNNSTWELTKENMNCWGYYIGAGLYYPLSNKVDLFVRAKLNYGKITNSNGMNADVANTELTAGLKFKIGKD